MEDKGLKDEFFNIRDAIIEKKYNYLSKEQKTAVFSKKKYALLVACPGAGKTKTLINRIDYLTTFGPIYKSQIHSNITRENVNLLYKYQSSNDNYNISKILGEFSVKPENIQVLTFTRAAAMEMKKRYLTMCRNKRSPFFGTFHSLFYKILKCYYSSIQIIKEQDQLEIIKSILKEYIGEISEVKAKQIISSMALYNASGHISVDKEILSHCYESYNLHKKENKFMDFDDLQFKCMELLNNDKELLLRYKNKFKYIMVDEFQDSAKKEMEFLKLFKEKSSIFAVGDEDQSIYCFRGANPEYMLNFKRDFKQGEILFLSKNYRSNEDIVLSSAKLIGFNNKRTKKNICSSKAGGKSIEIKHFDDESKEVNYITEIINNDLKKFLNKTAIIYRTNKEAELITNGLINKEIPFFFLNKNYEIYNNPICRDILCYIKLAHDKKDIKSFIEISNKPGRGISKEVLEEIKDKRIYNSWFDELRNSHKISRTSLKKTFYLNVLLFILNSISINKKIKYIRNVLGYDKYLHEYCMRKGETYSNVLGIIDKFNKYICSFSSVEDIINSSNSNSDNLKEGILLSTIHGVKGMEFDNVFILNCCEGSIPNEKCAETEIESERRLFYVGVTRAKNKVWLLIPEKISGIKREKSRFIDEINCFVE